MSVAAPASFSTLTSNRAQVLYYHAARLAEVRFRLYRLSDSEAETLLRRGFIDGWNPTTGEHISFSPEGEALREWTEPIAEELREASRLYSTFLSGDEPLPLGHYLVAVESEDLYSARKLVISVVDTALITKLASDELLVWALDHDTGEPIGAARVRAAPIEDAPLSPYQTATTDTNGLARFAVSSEADHDWRPYNWSPYGEYVVRLDEAGRAGVASTWWNFGTSPWWELYGSGDLSFRARPSWPSVVGYLYTDRPIYRPGDVVHYKGVARDEDDASYSIPGSETTFTLRVHDSRYDQVLDEPVQLSSLGTFSDEIVLPSNAPTGTYRVSLVDSEGNHITGASFTVAEFRVPEFKVEVGTAGLDYVAGETISSEARASFFFGGQVADAAVRWYAYSVPTSIRVEGYEDYSFSERDYRWSRSSRTALRGSGTGRTDALGMARFDLPVELEAGEGTQEVTISATVTDANAQAIAASTTATVHPSTWYAGIKPESYVGTAGEPETIHLVTVDFERRIAPNRPVTVRISEREWIRNRERNPHGGYWYRSEPHDTEIDVQTVTTGEDGEASITFTPPSAGTYRLVAESTDEEGRVARSDRFLWVSGEDHAPWPVRDDDAIELIADRERYEVGDVAEVLVPAPYAGATGLVTIERGRVLSTEVRRFETNSEVLRIPIEDRHIPNVFVGVVLYRPPTEDDPYPRYHVGYVELSISTAPRRLEVSIQPDREQAFPGETVRYEVQVTDAEGRGAEAEISVAVVDKAVLSLLDEDERDADGAFLVRTRPRGADGLIPQRLDRPGQRGLPPERRGRTGHGELRFQQRVLPERGQRHARAGCHDGGLRCGRRHLRALRVREYGALDRTVDDRRGRAGQLRAEAARQRHHLARPGPRRDRGDAGGRG